MPSWRARRPPRRVAEPQTPSSLSERSAARHDALRNFQDGDQEPRFRGSAGHYGLRLSTRGHSNDRRPYFPACERRGSRRVGRPQPTSRARVMSGAVLDAEVSRIEVGEYEIVCGHAVLRATAVGDEDQPVLVGDHSFISPQAMLLGCQVEAATYVAIGATVLHGARVRPEPWLRSRAGPRRDGAARRLTPRARDDPDP